MGLQPMPSRNRSRHRRYRRWTAPIAGAASSCVVSDKSLSAVCIQCLSIVDTQSLQVLQQFQAKERVAPLIPLGTRGKLHGDQ